MMGVMLVICKAAERMLLGGSEKGVNICSSCLSSESSLQGSASMWLLSVSSDHHEGKFLSIE